MLVKKHAEVTIRNTPENIWDFVNNPVNWTASNPKEHKGLEFFNERNRPETGTDFHQKEYVAGTYANLHGQIMYARRPHVAVWTGVATYKTLGGFLRPRIPEGGLVMIDESNGKSNLSHDVFMHFPDTLTGKFMLWYFRKILHGEEALYNHTWKELEFFKRELGRI